jgi:hypothetical protein
MSDDDVAKADKMVKAAEEKLNPGMLVVRICVVMISELSVLTTLRLCSGTRRSPKQKVAKFWAVPVLGTSSQENGRKQVKFTLALLKFRMRSVTRRKQRNTIKKRPQRTRTSPLQTRLRSTRNVPWCTWTTTTRCLLPKPIVRCVGVESSVSCFPHSPFSLFPLFFVC